MKSGFKLVRWLMVALLGVVLGLIYVYFNLSLLTVPTDSRSLRASNPATARFQISSFQVSKRPRAKALTQVIESQLSAFRNDDYPKAYEYAASTLTARMSLRAFERMVKHGFPVIARSRSAAYGLVFDNGAEAVVNVSIMDETGQTHHYRYFLELEHVGWRIRGVAEVEFEGTTV